MTLLQQQHIHLEESCNKVIFGVPVISFYTNLLPKSRVCRHTGQFGKHSETSDADVSSHMYVSGWDSTKPD